MQFLPSHSSNHHLNEGKIKVACRIILNDEFHDSLGWHNENHEMIRNLVSDSIQEVIMQRRCSPPPFWVEKLRLVVQFIEKRLYHTASSLTEYKDLSTLPRRLQDIANSISVEQYPAEKPSQLLADPSSFEFSSGSTSRDSNRKDDSIESVKGDEVDTGGSTKVKFSKKLLLQGMEGASFPAVKQVSSQGCSRVFIVKVLTCVSNFVKGKSLPSIFTFKRELVLSWLREAKMACCSPMHHAEESYYGGPAFRESDASTYWTEPHQLYTWWKNNVERRSKFRVLQVDAQYSGKEPRQLARARWCEVVVALTDVIRSSSGSMNNLRPKGTESLTETSSGTLLEVKSENSGSSPPKRNHRVIKYCSYLKQNASDESNSFENEPSMKSSTEGIKTSRVSNSKTFAPFPSRLYDMLEECEDTLRIEQNKYPLTAVAENMSSGIDDERLSSLQGPATKVGIHWTSDGRAFQIDYPNGIGDLLIKHFNHNNFKSFQRQLNLYGFRRLLDNVKGIYFHPQFLRGDKENSSSIPRVVSKGTRRSAGQDKDERSLSPSEIPPLPLDDPSDDRVVRKSERKPKRSRHFNDEYTLEELGPAPKHRLLAMSYDHKPSAEKIDARNQLIQSEEIDTKHARYNTRRHKKSWSNVNDDDDEETSDSDETTDHNSLLVGSLDSRSLRSRIIKNDTSESTTNEKISQKKRTQSNEKEQNRSEIFLTHGSPSKQLLSVNGQDDEKRKTSRIGRKYQAQIDEFDPSSFDPGNVDINNIKSNLVSQPYDNDVMGTDIRFDGDNGHEHDVDCIPSIGAMVIVRFPYRGKLTQQQQLLQQANHFDGLADDLALSEKRSFIYRYCCVIRSYDIEDESRNSDDDDVESGILDSEDGSNVIRVYDGIKETNVSVKSIVADMSSEFASWSVDEVAMICKAIQRRGDDLEKVKTALKSSSKTMKDIIHFYFYFHLHAKQQKGGYQRILRVFKRSHEESELSEVEEDSEEHEGRMDDALTELTFPQSLDTQSDQS